MLKPYPATVHEILARLNRLALGWLAGAVQRSPLWLAAEGDDEFVLADSKCLSSVVGSINLWVGQGTMRRGSPSLAQACAELQAWAVGKLGRAEMPETCYELLQAVLRYEADLTDAR